MGGLDTSLTKTVDEVRDGYTYFADGDVCVAKITPCFENGKGALAEKLINGTAFGTTELHVLRPYSWLAPRFLFYLTIADDFRKIGESEMLGAGGQKRIPERFIKDWKPLLPTLGSQHRIARFLDEKTARIDALIEKKRALLERLAEKRRALITQAVTQGLDPEAPMKDSGIEWLGQIPSSWRVKRLRFLLDGGTLNGLYKPKDSFHINGTPFVQMGEAFQDFVFTGGTEGRVVATADELDKWSLREGDFLIARRSLVFEGSGKSIRIGKLSEKNLFESSMIRIRPINAKYISKHLEYYFQSAVARAFFLSITKQVTISGVDSRQLKDVPVPLPTSNEELINISSFCETVTIDARCLSQKIENSISKLKEYRAALITAAVTGQLDIPESTDTRSSADVAEATLGTEVS